MIKETNPRQLFQALQPDLNALDAERVIVWKAMRKLLYTWIPTLGFSMVLLVWSAMSLDGILSFTGFAVFVLVVVVGGIKAFRIRKEFVNSFKRKIIDKIIKSIDPSFAYDPEWRSHHSSSDPVFTSLRNANLFASFSSCVTEDTITGTIKENKFELCELWVTKGSGKHKKQIFHGVMMKVDLNASLPSSIYILPDSANQFRDGLLKMFSMGSDRGKVVEFNHPEFERIYKVYGEDENFTRALLQPQILDRLVVIYNKVQAVKKENDPIRISFAGNRITIAVRLSVALFEPHLNRPVNDMAYFEKNVQYLLLFLGLIEDLKLSS